jgi:phosphoribosylanthranilate isomerase
MTRVKACGIARLEDAHLAAELGAWAIGMVFVPESPRACDPGTAEQVGIELKRKTEVAGVFVNWPLDELQHMADRASLTILQLHGDEGPVYCREAARRTGCKVMKAVQAKDAAAVRKLVTYREVDFHMLDAHSEDRRGGTGQTFAWELAQHHRSKVPLVLSGGLDAENVAAAVDAVHPFAVDSASGTEAEPGVKDPEKLRAFFDAVQSADARQAA